LFNSVSINNFKILEKLERVPLNKITLIGGKNNTGKTTFLEALFLYLDYKTPEVIEKIFSWRGFNGTWGPKDVWGKFFKDSELANKIIISLNSDNIGNGMLNISYLNDYEASVQIPVTENGITILRKNFPALEIKYLLNNTINYQAHILCHEKARNYLLEKDLLQEQYNVFYMGEGMRLYEKNTEYLGVLDKASEQDKVIPLLRLFEPSLVSLQLINDNGNNIIYADLGSKKKIPVNMLGDGFCRCMTMALILATKNAKLFLVDEIGGGIHYSMQDDLWKFLVQAADLYDCQIIATTHSYDTIKAFNNVINQENASKFSYIRFGRTEDIIKPYIFSSETLNYSLSSNLELR
jgi:AAA15 family ATPase/GTPase